MGTILQDLRYAFRLIQRAPWMTCVMVLTLAVGIGLNTGVFAILDRLMFGPHIENDPRSFVQVFSRYSG